jgi:hypothetical protein
LPAVNHLTVKRFQSKGIAPASAQTLSIKASAAACKTVRIWYTFGTLENSARGIGRGSEQFQNETTHRACGRRSGKTVLRNIKVKLL